MGGGTGRRAPLKSVAHLEAATLASPCGVSTRLRRVRAALDSCGIGGVSAHEVIAFVGRCAASSTRASRRGPSLPLTPSRIAAAGEMALGCSMASFL